MVKEETSILNEILYLIGMTCIFMATKFEEVAPLSIKQVEKTLGHNKHTSNEIYLMERKTFRLCNSKFPSRAYMNNQLLTLSN
jgi:hypothetical protein